MVHLLPYLRQKHYLSYNAQEEQSLEFHITDRYVSKCIIYREEQTLEFDTTARYVSKDIIDREEQTLGFHITDRYVSKGIIYGDVMVKTCLLK